ncbi:1-acyl-sn-glycerol-3-phosphate acyltransferase [Herbiconiux moechotypicola]|uniref:Phospholipid/glycerol acyltransferase domain-containing protein n=1 Tax=Herbiconiux moechotypicola TaxID=637393 RepID=A0ABP5Q282_9MICO|nr:lysophospholipid acyltransferase family protein [Herbiconiux moechotypicola]MCS5728294.1 1-acyl-sn-glycerol-3-phosphate acyltransferase [Herbiconiux moechotypicola]
MSDTYEHKHLIRAPKDRFTSGVMAGMRFVAQRMLLKPVVWSVTRVSVRGKDAVKGVQGAFIAVANHSSHLDAPLIMCALPRRLGRYLAAGAAADYFFDIWWRRILTSLFFNAFPIDRTGTAARQGVSKKLLGRGVPLLVFPEGTRSKTGQMAEFKAGAAALSISCDVPCVPVAIVGASLAMPRGRNWPIPGRPPVAVVFGEPMLGRPGETPDQFSARIAREVRRLHEREAATAEIPSLPAIRRTRARSTTKGAA